MDELDNDSEVASELSALRHRVAELEAAETMRKAAESALHNQLKFLQKLIDTIPNPIFYKDNRFLYLGCNKAFEQRAGLRREEIVGKSARNLFPPELAAKYEDTDATLMENLGEQSQETTLLYADGIEHDVIINKGTFTSAEGKPAGLVGVTIDISERKKAEEALRKAHDELEARVKARTADLAKAIDDLRFEVAERKRAEEALLTGSEKLKLFAYSVAHDLKSPAIAIHGLAKILDRRYGAAMGEEGGNICSQVLRASEHVVSLVDAINVFIATKETPLQVEPVNVKEVLRMVKEEFSARLAVRRVNWSEPEDIPDFRADRLSIMRMFRNLVDNALKYGGEQLSRIEVRYCEDRDLHIVSVIDDGVGLKSEDSGKIFEFFQRHRNSKDIEGAGLGLAIVREIAERHHGEVWVESKSGDGTAFHVSISKHL